jgi:hypothetical protein
MSKDTYTQYESLRERILTFMIERGWKDKIAKRSGFEQSLLEHSANCLDVMLTFLPTLKANLRLSDEEEQALILGTAIHDVAKERDEWQAYVQGKSEYEPHVIPSYTTTAVTELAERLGFEGQQDAQATANLHMRSVQTAARIFVETQNAGRRVILLQRLVDAVDSIASANGLLAARDALTRGPLGKHFNIAYHVVQVRGVSTTLLHRAAQAAFEQQGWTPLLFYPTGTFYVCSGAQDPLPVTAEMVRRNLTTSIKEVVEGKTEVLPSLIVGSIIATFLPKPEIFDHRSLKQYLMEATKRAGQRPGEKVNPKNAWKYANYRGLLESTQDLDIARCASAGNRAGLMKAVPESYHHLLIAEADDLSELETRRLLERMGEVYPEMAIFKFFREATKLMDEKGLTATKSAYNDLFGQVAFDALISTSTLMPAKDLAFTVDFFWNLPLKKLANFLQKPELDVEGTAGTLDSKRRVTLMIDTLAKIGAIGFAAMEYPPTVDNFAQEVAAVLIADLIAPVSVITDVGAHAGRQLAYYKQAKHNIRTEREVEHICPICNHPFERAKTAKADYLDKPGGFTGRKFAYDQEALTICLACYYERLLRQIVLGRKAYDLIVLMPRMSIGRYGGKILMDKLSELNRYIKSIATADTTDPDETLRLDMAWFVTPQAALAADFNRMSAKDLIALFTYRTKEDTIKDNLKKVIKETRSIFGDDLEAVNDFWEHDFADWIEVACAIAYKELDDDIAQSIREAIYGLRPPIEFVAQTPNLVLAPSSNPRISDSSALVDSKDSDAKAALKQMLTTIILALGLDCSVAVLHDRESLDALILESNGMAYVPPLSSVRSLVANSRSKTDRQRLNPAWLSQSETARWLRALASAILLANQANYPPRNDLYQILTARSKGALLRRIEQKEGGKMYSENWQQLEAIGEVLP